MVSIESIVPPFADANSCAPHKCVKLFSILVGKAQTDQNDCGDKQHQLAFIRKSNVVLHLTPPECLVNGDDFLSHFLVFVKNDFSKVVARNLFPL